MIEFDNENLQNGYIYKELVKKIETLQEQNESIMKMINEASSNNRISVKDYVSIIKEIGRMATSDSLTHHTDDNDIHITRSEFNTILKRLSIIEEKLGISSK